MEAAMMIRAKLTKVVDRLLVRVLPEDTAAGCCPPDNHYLCVVNTPCHIPGTHKEFQVHYTCNCTAIYSYVGKCCIV